MSVKDARLPRHVAREAPDEELVPLVAFLEAEADLVNPARRR
jgi:hypothetical protein